MPRPGEGSAVPNSSGYALPAVLPAGVIPPDESRMWLFVPKAIAAGEPWIQDDTREWFRDRDGRVPIARSYPDHPRWKLLDPDLFKTKKHNADIVSEVHMLARISAEPPRTLFPDWVPVKISIKQAQADIAYRLTKASRDVLATHGKKAMVDFAERMPGQWLKFLGATFIPKKIEANVTSNPVMDDETADTLIDALKREMDRRIEQARDVTIAPTDYIDVDPIAGARAAALEIHEATGDHRLGFSRHPDAKTARRLGKLVDLNAPEVPTAPKPEWPKGTDIWD